MELIESRSIFSPATGFIKRGGFEWTCNPSVGCTFSCSYCYAAYLPQNRRPPEEWGKWITAKKNAAELAEKQSRKVAGQCVYMSSVTDGLAWPSARDPVEMSGAGSDASVATSRPLTTRTARWRLANGGRNGAPADVVRAHSGQFAAHHNLASPRLMSSPPSAVHRELRSP